jgi:hypothetical protein
LLESVRKLVEASPPSSTGIILNLGDFVHADDSRNQTARSGNPLDVDTRYQKVVQVAVRALIACVIRALAKHDRVILRNVPGNHDTHTAIALTVALAAYFHNEPRVTVDDSPSRFFFHKFGHVMIAAAHGDMIKPTEMAGMCAARQPEMWGSTKYRHGLMGHIHHASAKEMNGMLVETFRTIAARDAWHAAGPHTAQRSICHIVFDRNKGEDSRKSINI